MATELNAPRYATTLQGTPSIRACQPGMKVSENTSKSHPLGTRTWASSKPGLYRSTELAAGTTDGSSWSAFEQNSKPNAPSSGCTNTRLKTSGSPGTAAGGAFVLMTNVTFARRNRSEHASIRPHVTHMLLVRRPCSAGHKG